MMRLLTCTCTLCGLAAAGGTPNGRGCLDAAARKLPYCDATLDLDARLADLSGRLTLEEMIPRIESASLSPAVERVGLPAQNYRVEAVHGLEGYCLEDGSCPTYLPITQGVAATFNRTVFGEMGRIVGEEARLWTNLGGAAKGGKPVGPSVRCPMVNVLRDPRWGRSDESASEDPYLTAEFGKGVVRGIQRRDASGFLLAAAEVKHLGAYSLETNWRHESDGRKGYSARVTAFDWTDTYVVPFEATLRDAGALSYMCSYNAINGTPSCASSFLAETLARGEWKLRGFVESDCDAVGDIERAYHIASDAAEASAYALENGTDVDCGGTFSAGLADAVKRNLTSLARVRLAFERAMRPLFLSGMFSPVPTAWDGLVDAPSFAADHERSAADAAAQSMVLLKNDGGALPFPTGRTVALLGPMALATDQLFGPITIGPCASTKWGGGYKEDYSCVKTLNASVAAYAKRVIVEPGVANFTSEDESLVAAAVRAAEEADFVILALGAGLETVDEKEDLWSLGLPGAQTALANAVAAVGKPTAAVLVMGNQYAIDGWAGAVPAILNAFVPSGVDRAADVIAATLFGRNRRFGKLPYTMYEEKYADDVALASASFANRGYRYYDGPRVSFPFGHGLSYAAFALANAGPPSIELPALADATARVSVTLAAAGAGGDEVLQVYAEFGDDVKIHGARVPTRRLVDFSRVNVRAGAAEAVSFVVKADAFALVDAGGVRRVIPGTYALRVTTGDPRTPPVVIRATVTVS